MELIPHKSAYNKSYHRYLKPLRHVLQHDGVLMYPTDTCWGLSASLFSEKGIEKIYQIKKRSRDKSVSIAVSDIQMADHFAHISPKVRAFMRKFLPGRISLIVPAKSEKFPAYFPLNQETISIRIPADVLTRKISQSINAPIITTSANFSSEKELYTWKEVEHFLENLSVTPDIVIKRAQIPRTAPSTIIDTTTTPWRIVRQGPFVLE